MSDPVCNWCEQPGCPGDVRCVRDGRMLPGHLSKLDERLAGIVSRHAGALAALAKGPQADVPAEQIAAEWEASARTTRDEMSALTSRLAAVEAERDEARALKVPPTVDELNAALMDAAVAKAERDVAIVRTLAAEAEVARLRGAWEAALADVARCLTTLAVDVPADVAPAAEVEP